VAFVAKLLLEPVEVCLDKALASKDYPRLRSEERVGAEEKPGRIAANFSEL
jgi:hypothetical protein